MIQIDFIYKRIFLFIWRKEQPWAITVLPVASRTFVVECGHNSPEVFCERHIAKLSQDIWTCFSLGKANQWNVAPLTFLLCCQKRPRFSISPQQIRCHLHKIKNEKTEGTAWLVHDTSRPVKLSCGYSTTRVPISNRTLDCESSSLREYINNLFHFPLIFCTVWIIIIDGHS